MVAAVAADESGDWGDLGRELEAEDAAVSKEAKGILRRLLGRLRERKAMKSLGAPMQRARLTA